MNYFLFNFLGAQQRSEIEMNLREEGIAPPMSLSSPELGAGVFELPPLRDAISSTELLYERTAARLYQNAMEEEEQRVVRRRYSADRKSVERRASLKEALIERRRSFKENEEEETSERPKLEQNKIETMNESAQKFYLTIPISNAGRERLSSVEKEQLEFALIREKLQKKEEERQALSTSVQHLSDTTTTTSSSFEGIDAEDEEYEDEYLEEEEEESYLEDIQKDLEEHEKEEKLDVPMANIYKFKESKIPIREVLPSLKPNKMAPFAVAESDTCTPKSMIPTRSVLSRIQNISEGKALKELKASPKVEKKEVLNISKIPVSAPKKAKKASKLLRKFGLKKEKKLLEEIPVDPNLPPPPKPILKNKTMAKTKNSPIKRLNLSVSKLAEKSISEEESENDLAGRKKKVRISEPDTQSKIAKEIQKSEDENTVENQVLIYHYSDIVKEFGGGKKPPAKLYLNYDELKAHAKPEDPSEKTNPRPKNLEKIEPSNLKQMPATDNADEVEEIRNELSQELPEEAHQEKTIEQSSPSSSAIGNLESKIYFSLEYATDVAMFIFACWLYFFKSEIYAIPVLCIMAYRQLKEITLKKYKKLIDTISKKIPQVIKKKTETNKNS